MKPRKVWAAAEMEVMSPNERAQLVRDGMLDSLDDLDPEFSARVKAKERQLAERYVVRSNTIRSFGFVLLGLLAACGSGAGTSSESDPLPRTTPLATATSAPTGLPDPTSTPVVEPTATAAPTPTPMPTPTPTPTPEPLDVLTLTDAQAGVNGVNWIAQVPDGEMLAAFTAPNGAVVEIDEWTGTEVRDSLVISGTPEDEWVEVLLVWTAPNGQTAWVRSSDVTFTSSDVVLEINRSNAELILWQAGERIWTGTDLTDREGAEKYMPLGLGSFVGEFPSDRPNFSPVLLGTSHVLANLEGDFVPVLGIRGVNDGVSVETARAGIQDRREGTSIWIRTSSLDELIALMPLGSRVEIVE